MSLKITISRGTTKPFIYQHTSDGSAPEPLTGCTVYFTAKAEKYDSDAADSTAVLKKTITSHTGTIEGTTLDSSLGITGWVFDDLETQQAPGKYYWNVLVEDANGHTDPPSLQGILVIEPNQANRQVGNES